MGKGREDNTIDYMELPVNGPEALASARDFYHRAFGWDYKQWGDSYCDTPGNGFASGINATEERSTAPLVVLYSLDLEASLERVKAAGGVITRDILPFPGGRRFHFRDPAGNELAVWSDESRSNKDS